ncbi:hypothetical protein Mucpa_0815 [Mucilaginibacter paludis DSM 18603]|uniref:Uncharacterized protein n=2 Tax=Mucilaginibacter TaxID=423349 RepID=H1YA12_9SPHI|nr:hypothetical protein Mucpa_0815 [Mucilaginibacter paludis DSM 18603]
MDILSVQSILASLISGNASCATAQLATCLSPYLQQPGLCSRLTNRGIPIELAFVWPNYQVRCTIDEDMYSDQETRFSKSLKKVSDSRDNGTGQIIINHLYACLQSTPQSFRYGAWLGLRPSRAVPKLYVEIAPATRQQNVLGQHIPDIARVMERGILPVMFGWQADSGSFEVYYKASFMYPADIDKILSFYKLPLLGADVEYLCKLLVYRNINQHYPMPDIGFSVSFNAQGVAEAFTLYAFAQSMLGPDFQIRHAILRLGDHQGWNMEQYKLLSQPLETPDYCINTYHGMVGFVVAKEGGVQFTVGLSPFLTEDMLGHAV